MAEEYAVQSVLDKFKDDEIMIDALNQWAMNPTSMSAGYGIEENYPYIKENLRVRYDLSEKDVDKYIGRLKEECNKILSSKSSDAYWIGRVREKIKNAINQQWGEKLKSKILEKVEKSSEELKNALYLWGYLWGKLGKSIIQHNFKVFKAFYNAAIGNIGSLQIDDFVKVGMLNKLLWITTRGNYYIEYIVPLFAEEILKNIDLYLKKPETPDVHAYISALFHKNRYEQLRLIDEVLNYRGLIKDEKIRYNIVTSRGIVGKYEDLVAISPLVLEKLEKILCDEKEKRIKYLHEKINNSLESLRKKYWPDVEVVYPLEFENLWKIEAIEIPPLYIYLSTWLTTNAVRGKFKDANTHLLIVVTNQSFPSVKDFIDAYPYYFEETTVSSISVLCVSEGKWRFRVLRGEKHKFVEEIVNYIKDEIPTMVEIIPSQELPRVVKKIGGTMGVEVAPESITPTQTPRTPEKEATIIKEPIDMSEHAVIVGCDSLPKQYGIVGITEGGRKVILDLNAPHIVFVSGMMGAGKGYTIGTIAEMLVSNSIRNISNVEKKATIIVLYKPRDDVPSEFWSIQYPNDVKDEIEILERQYGASPTKVIDEDKFRVFLDPNVYSKHKSVFSCEYQTSNIYPLYIDPATLIGEDWANALATGGESSLYIKEIFKILRELPSDFDLDTIRRSVDKSNLTEPQKRFARARLDNLKEYLKKDDFMNKLAIGGVNIFDFRKAMYTEDDIFTIMTLIISRLQNKKELEKEPFVFIINEAHMYFKKVAEEFVEIIENLIRRKRHGANWLLLDTHLPNDVDSKIIQLSDIKILHFLDKTVNSPIPKQILEGTKVKPYELKTGECIICANVSSEGLSKPIFVKIRPRITKHGGTTKTAI